MSTFSERGHAKQVDNFRDLINFIRAYGPRYNPSKNSLKLPQLEDLLLNSQVAIDNVTTQKSLYEDIVNKRALAFAGLRILSTRLINALDSTDASPNRIKNAKTYHRKLQGVRASSTTTPNNYNTAISDNADSTNISDTTTSTTDPIDINMSSDNTISVSQLSYTKQIQHFSGLIGVLRTETSYMPNEVDLQITTLEAMKADLIAKNEDISSAIVAMSNVRLERNKLLYTDANSIYKVAAEAKKYIKSLFGANSAEFAQVRGIEFTNK